MNTKSNLLKSIFISLILVMGVSNVWGATVTLRYQANMPSGNYNASNSQTMTVSSIDGNRYYCELSLSANTSYGFFIKKDNNYYKANINASSSKSEQLYDYGSSNYGNSNHRVTYKTGSSEKYIFTFDASNNKIVVSPQSETVELVYDKANGHDDWWDLDNKKAMTQDGSNYYCDVDLSKEKYYMFIRINNTIFWRGASALPHALYYYGDSNLGNSGDKMNYTPTATSKHRFIWNHLDKTLSVKPFYTVTFDANGHGTAPGAQTILSGTKATEPTAPTATGYTFGGWYKESGCTNKYDFNTAVTDNLTLYAKWTLSEQQYTVTAVANPTAGGTVTPTTATQMGQTSGGSITATANTGYTFNNWTIKSGSGYFGASGTNTTSTTAETKFRPKATSTVQANFTAKTYTITYNDLYGVTHSNPTTYTIESETITFTNPTSERTGYTFAGWNPTQIAQGSTGNQTVSAQWNEILSTITITTNPAEGGCIEVDGKAFTPGNTVQVGVATTKQVTAVPNEGYGIASWGVSNKEIVNASGGATVTLKSDGSGSTGTLTANFIGLEYTITFDKQKGTNGTDKATVRYMGNEYSVSPVVAPTRTGFTFGGYYSKEKGAGEQVVSAEGAWLSNANGYTDADGNWLVKGNTTLYAHWIGAPYTVELNQEGAATSGTEKVTAYYEGDMPTADVTMPTAQNGYAFMGYWDKKDGQGTQYYNADGTSAHVWNKTEDATLYAYFAVPKIEVTLDKSTFEPRAENVTATATVTPTPAGTTTICWKLLYANDNPVDNHAPSPEDGNSVQFNISDLVAGTYKIKATLRMGDGCEGEEICSSEHTFLISSSHTITIKYICDGKEIQSKTTIEANVSSTTTYKAPDIVGYTFSTWEAGDGVTITETNGKEVTFNAFYDGYLTAKYTKNSNIIYFYNTLGWENVYVYFYNDANGYKYWTDNYGTGAHQNKDFGNWDRKPFWEMEHGQMQQIEGTNIWYFQMENKRSKVAFATVNQTYMEGDNVSNTTAYFQDAEVVYRDDLDSEGRLPMFVPNPTISHDMTNTKSKYYNHGYWMNYPENTGYTLDLFNHHSDNDPARYFIYPYSKNTIFPLQLEVEINAENIVDGDQKIWFRIHRNDGKNFGGHATNFPTVNPTTTGGFIAENDYKVELITPIAGTYTFILDYKYDEKAKDYKYHISVDYPAAVGDYRILYRDAAEKTWSGKDKNKEGNEIKWCHPSRIIKKKEGAIDTISFFVNTKKEPKLLYQTIKSINASTGAITWNAAQEIKDVKWNVIEKDGVINFTFTQSKGAIAVTNIELYKGNYYIRVDAVDGQWGHYKTNADNRMTYSAFSESDANSFGEKFSHYKTQWCPRGTNVKFTIANDYSPCITDTLIQDVTRTWDENIDQYGKLKSDGSQDPTADKYSANIRFMWNRNTNKISRAYLSSATNVTKKFLILQGDDKMKNAEGEEIVATEHVPADATLLDDKQNWIYETTIKVQPGARVKLYACYTKTAVEDAQYFRGTNAAFSESSTVQILGGTGETWNTMRVIYDFKTNRLMGAWVPDTEIGDNGLQIDADIMIMREHQEEATCINLTENANSKLTDVKTVYGVMRFNRWILNNRANPKDLDVDHCSTLNGNDRNYDEGKVKEYHPVLPLIEQKSIYERSLYFISFPFDVNLSDVFGFGTYWNEWYIEYYDGLKRAREGFFIDSPPNWKYVTPEMADTFKLRAYQGYILGLDLDYMQYDNTSFWAHNTGQMELFFPSTANVSTIEKTNYLMDGLSDDYICKINYNKDGNNPEGDRRVKDTYWRCIGVPSFADYDGSLYKTKEDAENEENAINWKDNYTWQADYSGFPFLYEWNTADNSITPVSTQKYTFRPTFAYLVQNGNPIYWSAVNTKPSNIVARRQAASEINNYEWKLTLLRNEQIEDQAFVRLSDDEQVTTEFDFNQDLSKEFNYGRSDIYTLIGYEKAAANSLPFSEQTTLIPLGLSIEYNGDYTIAMPGRMENIGVTLIDTETNTRTNLSAGMEYTLTLNKGDYNNRFFIEISPIQQTPTDIEYVTGDSNSQNSVRKVLIDNILYIVRDGEIFDARGARVK